MMAGVWMDVLKICNLNVSSFKLHEGNIFGMGESIDYSVIDCK